ncbi:MAG: HlyD family secretion protein [Xanthobacteraceae bacterium]|nr:HlyD family secretion protein [Xanthobacteraceae bacterium]MBV9631576.1 HlyD family secretion protein [Xanthobacteraceae bacterium]
MGMTAVAEVLDKTPPALRSGSEPALRQISAPAIAAPAAKGDRRKSLRRLALTAGLLAAVAGGGWYGDYWWTTGRFIESTDDAYVGGNVTPLAPHVDGFIERVLVTDNERVHAGQVLIELDPRDYQSALENTQAVLKARAAAADSLRAQYTLQQSTIRQQEADIIAKKAQATFASQEAARAHVLAQQSFGSRQTEDHNVALEQEAQAAVTVAQAALEAANQQLKVLDAQIAQADAAVAQAKADVHTAELNLSYTEIKSPIDGYVGNRAGQIGAYVTHGTYLISVTPADGLWVDANFKEDQLARMVPGQIVNLTADALPGHVFHGHVASLQPGTGAVFSVIPAENATGNFTKIVQRVPVRVVLDNGDPALMRLRPGLSTIVNVDTREGGVS